MAFYVAKSICQSPEESISCGESLDRTHTKRFDVVLDLPNCIPPNNADISPLQVYEDIIGLPQYGEVWQSRDGMRIDLLSVMRSWTCKRSHDDKAKFSLTFNYTPRGKLDTPKKPDRNTGGGTDDISKLFPVWSITTEDKMEAPDNNKDLDGRRILNAAGDPFEPTLEFNHPIIVLNWSRYETSFNSYTADMLISDVQTFKYKTNTDEFLKGPSVSTIGKWLIAEYSLHPEFIGNTRVIRRDITFKFNEFGWKDRILNAGLYEVIDDTETDFDYVVGEGPFPMSSWVYTNKRQIYSPMTGQPVTRPWPLTVMGKAITDPRATDVNYMFFRSKSKVFFSNLNIVLI